MAEPIDMQVILKYVKDKPQDILGWNALYLALEAAGEIQKANECRKTIATLHAQSKFTPESVQTLKQMYLEAGEASIEQGNYTQAVNELSRVIELDEQSAQAYQLRGVANWQLHQYPQALQDQTRAIELKTDYTLAYYYRGRTYIELSQFPQAISDFSRAIKLDPGYMPSYYSRGLVYFSKSDYLLAYKDFDRAHILDPDDQEVVEYRTRTMQLIFQ